MKFPGVNMTFLKSEHQFSKMVNMCLPNI